MTEQELKDLLKKYNIFGITDWSLVTINQSFWSQYAYNSPTYNNAGSAASLEHMETIQKYYKEGNEAALEEFLAGVVQRLESSGEQLTQAEAAAALMENVDEMDNLTDEQKEEYKNAIVKGFLDKTRLVPQFDVGLEDDLGSPIFDRQVTDEFGNVQEVPFSSYFTGGIEGVFNYNMSQPDIIQFQDLLEETGIVEDGFFADTKGQPSANLRLEIAKLMLFIDSNIEAHPGTSLRNEIMNNYEPLFFDEFAGGATGDNLFQQKLLSYGVQQYVKQKENQRKMYKENMAGQLLERYNFPGPLTMEKDIEAFWLGRFGHNPSAAELDHWSTQLAQSYSTSFNQSLSKLEAIEAMEYVQSPPSGTFRTNEETGQMEYVQTREGSLGIDAEDITQLGVDSPEVLMESKLESQLGPELDLAAQATEKRKRDADMLRMIYG